MKRYYDPANDDCLAELTTEFHKFRDHTPVYFFKDLHASLFHETFVPGLVNAIHDPQWTNPGRLANLITIFQFRREEIYLGRRKPIFLYLESALERFVTGFGPYACFSADEHAHCVDCFKEVLAARRAKVFVVPDEGAKKAEPMFVLRHRLCPKNYQCPGRNYLLEMSDDGLLTMHVGGGGSQRMMKTLERLRAECSGELTLPEFDYFFKQCRSTDDGRSYRMTLQDEFEKQESRARRLKAK